jgi:hypothetical protein
VAGRRLDPDPIRVYQAEFARLANVSSAEDKTCAWTPESSAATVTALQLAAAVSQPMGHRSND